MISKTEFFHEIFEDFVCLEESIHDNDIWKSNSIIKLMKASHEIEDKHIITEGLKMILYLCKFAECGELIDFYEAESHSINDLTAADKYLVDTILKAEFT
jgi:hypothetical protein